MPTAPPLRTHCVQCGTERGSHTHPATHTVALLGMVVVHPVRSGECSGKAERTTPDGRYTSPTRSAHSSPVRGPSVPRRVTSARSQTSAHPLAGAWERPTPLTPCLSLATTSSSSKGWWRRGAALGPRTSSQGGDGTTFQEPSEGDAIRHRGPDALKDPGRRGVGEGFAPPARVRCGPRSARGTAPPAASGSRATRRGPPPTTGPGRRTDPPSEGSSAEGSSGIASPGRDHSSGGSGRTPWCSPAWLGARVAGDDPRRAHARNG